MLIESNVFVITEVIDETHRVIRSIYRDKERARKKANLLRKRTGNFVEVFQKIDI